MNPHMIKEYQQYQTLLKQVPPRKPESSIAFVPPIKGFFLKYTVPYASSRHTLDSRATEMLSSTSPMALCDVEFNIGLYLRRDSSDGIKAENHFYFSFDENIEKLIRKSNFGITKEHVLCSNGEVKMVYAIRFSAFGLHPKTLLFSPNQDHPLLPTTSNIQMLRREMPLHEFEETKFSDIFSHLHLIRPGDVEYSLFDFSYFPQSASFVINSRYLSPSLEHYYSSPFKPLCIPTSLL